MPFESKLTKKANGMTWIIPSSFAFMCLLLVLGIIFLFIKRFDRLETTFAFSIGADIACMAICAMLGFGTLSNRKEPTGYTRIFITLITLTSMALFIDECAWIVDGVVRLSKLNLAINIHYFANSAALTFFFWKYVTYALDLDGKFMKILNAIMNVFFIPNIILPFVNAIYPIYFYIDEFGKYQRSGLFFWISQIYNIIGVLCVILALIFSKAPIKTKLITGSFIAIPVLNQVITQYKYGVSTQYTAMLVSIVLIFVVLYSDRGKQLATTGKELALATRIQADMLPNIYPAFPERKEFDIYATMTPAKEVGGDFYDFFLIDDNHLALVIADVSGKGVPAALFMMVSKILIQNCALAIKSPKDVLEAVNNQICQKNKEEMFVTTWLGILNFETGKMVCANAGHEYPVLKQPNQDFELIRDKHGFVIGGMPGAKYKEYELQLEPDAKLFVYTDGVPEATNSENVLYGTTRMVDALNESKDKTPKEILVDIEKSVKDFVKDAPQFDDLTMLCLHYKGN